MGREILPGKFDLEAAYKEWKKQRQATETRKYLRESKDRISQSMKQLPTDQMDGDGLISTVVLQMILEQVTLTLIGTKIGGNIHTFVNIAMAWALYEQDIFNSNMLTTEESRLCNGLGLCHGNGMLPLPVLKVTLPLKFSTKSIFFLYFGST